MHQMEIIQLNDRAACPWALMYVMRYPNPIKIMTLTS